MLSMILSFRECPEPATRFPRIPDTGSPVSGNYPSETVRKVPTGSKLKPQKSTKRSKKPYFAAVGSQNGGSSGYSKPFSDSLRRVILGNSFSGTNYRGTQSP